MGSEMVRLCASEQLLLFAVPFGSNALRAPWSLALGMAFVATISILPYGQVLFSLVRSFLVRYGFELLEQKRRKSVGISGTDGHGQHRELQLFFQEGLQHNSGTEIRSLRCGSKP